MKFSTYALASVLFVTLWSVSAQAYAESNPNSLLREKMQESLLAFKSALANPKKDITSRDVSNAALLNLALGGASADSRTWLELLFKAQNMDARSPEFGNVPWGVRGREDVKDENAIEFTGQGLGPLFLAYASGLNLAPSVWQPHLKAMIRATLRHDVPVHYTNIYLMKLTNLILLGQSVSDSAAIQAGEGMMDQWLRFTAENGITEYDSPTYFSVDLNDLMYGYLFTASETTRARFKKALDIIWEDIANNFFRGQRNLGGPHSRDYDFLLSKGGLDLHLFAAGLISQVTEDKWDLEKTALLINGLRHGYQPSSEILAKAASLPRVVTQRWHWGEDTGKDRYHFITDKFSIGTASHDYCPYDKSVLVELASPKDLVGISVVPDDTDNPYGKNKVKSQGGHSKPHHLALRPMAVQNRETALILGYVWPDGKTPQGPGLATNVLLPLDAAGIYLDGNKVDLDSPRELPMSNASVVAVTAVEGGGATVAIRVLAADGCAGKPRIVIKSDSVGIQNRAARIAIYHDRGDAGTTPSKCKAKIALIFSAGTDREKLVNAVRQATYHEQIKENVWSASATLAGHRYEAARSLKDKKPILYRRVDGREMVFGK